MLGDTLVNEFSAAEIETVLAHELGHHVHKDLTTGIIVQIVTLNTNGAEQLKLYRVIDSLPHL